MTRVTRRRAGAGVGFARADITPPVGIYHRMWGAALHDRATGVHRPLTATALWLEPPAGGDAAARARPRPLHPRRGRGRRPSATRSAAARRCRRTRSFGHAVAHARVGVDVAVAGAPARRRPDRPVPRPARRGLCRTGRETAARAVPAGDDRLRHGPLFARRPPRLLGRGPTNQFVCGFNPAARPTTRCWWRGSSADDRRDARDASSTTPATRRRWPGRTRSSARTTSGRCARSSKQHTGVPCLFLQGASGDLGPRRRVRRRPGGRRPQRPAARVRRAVGAGGAAAAGDAVRVRRAGRLRGGPRHVEARAARPDDRDRQPARCVFDTLTVELPYRPDLPTAEETRRELGPLAGGGSRGPRRRRRGPRPRVPGTRRSR